MPEALSVGSQRTNMLSPSPKCFQSPKFSDSDFREVRGLGLGRPKSSDADHGRYNIIDLI
jgi:hypothetical protein